MSDDPRTPASIGDIHRVLNSSTFTDLINALAPATAGDTSFEDVAAAINTVNKVRGRMVYDVTTNQPVWAGGSDADDVWRFADGTTAYTPV